MSKKSAVMSMEEIHGMHWRTLDPFLFCAHHKDEYPASMRSDLDDGDVGVVDPKRLRGRDIGSDFSEKEGFSMYHGERGIPGFPNHPHYGFETITIVTRGVVDHSDSLGQSARYGEGDVQWLTAGSGIQHAEMFPLLNSDAPNSLEMFQLWLNLPAKSKTVPPYFTIAWNEDQPRQRSEDGRAVLQLVGGKFMGLTSVPPPPNSYASDPSSELVIARISIKPNGEITLPAASQPGLNRALYLYEGGSLTVDGTVLRPKMMAKLRSDRDVRLSASEDAGCEVLFLQGKPIGEQLVQHGPFVANSRKELEQAFSRFERTKFGGWKWPRPDPVHARAQGRFYQRRGERKQVGKAE